MIDITTMVARLVAAGCSPEIAAQTIAEAYAEGIQFGVSTTRVPVDSTAEKRRAWDRERKRKRALAQVESTGIHPIPQSASLSKEKKEEGKEEREAVSEPIHRKANRGHRLPDDWQPAPDDWGAAADKFGADFARSELAKFRDYWKAQPGQRGVKLDWDATWRNWIRNARSPPGSTAKPLTPHQQEREKTRNILDALDSFSGNGSGQADLGLLRHDSGGGSGGVRGGVRGDVIDLPATRIGKGN